MRVLFYICLCVATNIGFSQDSEKITITTFEKLYQESKFNAVISVKQSDISASSQYQGKISMIYAKSFESLNEHDKALSKYKEAKDYFIQKNDREKIALVNLYIYDLLDSNKNLNIDKSYYLNEIKQYAEETNSKKWFMAYYNFVGLEKFKADKSDAAKTYFFKAKALAQEIDSLRALYKLNINIGALYSVDYNMPDSALYYYQKALVQFEQDTDEDKKNNELFALYNNIGNVYRDKEQYTEALGYYKKAENIDLKQYDKVNKRILYSNMDINYYYLNDFENAYNYLFKYDSINEIINLNKQNTNITAIEEKYNNEKLRANNLESEANRIRNRNIAIGLGGSLILGSVIVVLVYNDRKRKQQLKTQQLSSKLKEEELKSINALVEGQEKERLAIANDLHDDLGSLMATIKLHFSSFKDSKTSQDLFLKTNTLLDEAYQKIRHISHAKNSGVLAKQGLYEAITKLSKSISDSEKIKVNVQENGLSQRLENSLELTIFRIVQELITNVIKHAKATELNIQFTEHDNVLNIMVEDNGIGFNTAQQTKKVTGIGLLSIERRVEQLEGEMIIESHPKNGTAVIIDIPIGHH